MPEPLFGVDYYPEHWPETRRPLDARLMAEAGITCVRLAEFAWSRLEPAPGAFDFAWLDRAIDVLTTHGIQIILGTPTAAPPAWLIEAHPEILPVNEDGVRASFGMRRHYCPSQPAFHEATARIVTAMADHYAGHPAVFAWQIDNEFGNITNGNRCHCPVCRDAFARWLEERYGSLAELNRRWGTVFWSQEYTRWAQIPVPVRHTRAGIPGTAHNPALFLDFARFTSEQWVRYQRLQTTALRARCPNHLLTHNMMGLFPYLDYAALARDLDVVSWDNYPRLPAPFSPLRGDWSPARVAMAHDLMRGITGRPFWVMEQQAGPSGWSQVSPTPLPGELRLWTLQAIAHGAEAIIYFRWRTCRVGTEQYWHGILPHDGTPGRRYEEIRRVGREIRALGGLVKTPVVAEVAIVRSYETLWAFEAQPTAEGLSYDGEIARYYQALWRRRVPVDLRTETRDWTAYRVLIAPCLFVVGEELPARLRAWVEAGGVLVLTFRSGVKDENNTVSETPLPGALRDLAGVRVSDYTALLPAGSGEPCADPLSLELTIDGTPRRAGTAIWQDELVAEGATVLGRYCGGPFAGAPALTRQQLRAGAVFYVGTALDETGMDLLSGAVLEAAGIAADAPSGAPLEMVRRVHEGAAYWFVLNCGAAPLEVTVPAGTDLLSGRPVAGVITLDGLDALVVRAG